MRRVGVLTTVVAIAVGVTLGWSAPPAGAQSQGLGGVLETITGILGGTQRVHGHVVLAKETRLVFRADDGRTYAVSTDGLDSRVRTMLQPGDGVTMVLRAPRNGAEGDVTATDVNLDPANGQSRKTFRTVEGTVEEAERSRVLFRTRDGLVLPVDVSAIRGLPALGANDAATLYYEQDGRQGILGVWIEPGGAEASAAVSETRDERRSDRKRREERRRDDVRRDDRAAEPSGRSDARRTDSSARSDSTSGNVPTSRSEPGSEVQRLHGVVDRVDRDGFTLKADDGHRYVVQTGHLDKARRGAVRAGDAVTVFARPGDAVDSMVAEYVARDGDARR